MRTGIVTKWSKAAPRFPWVTLTIVLLCTGVLLLQSGMSPLAQNAMLELGGVLPDQIVRILDRPVSQWWDHQLLSLVSALFIHADWLHLVGNIVYLWVFGVPLERRIGSLGMMLVFVFGGALANLFVVLRLPELSSPIVGASGAISAVVGAYLVLFPFRRIGMLLPLGLYLQFARVPAILVIGSWFTLQLVYTVLGPITGVVAWWTHMTGFALGLIFALLVRALAQIKIG
ncbi:MAG: rhomboid family intramembrane serine protease [Xanthomonadales bacterium]|nr:rhomboid family intramembrane serine protease [Gammaproteobacteria bacterium]MBT8075964.1 rhomboid family intramembrane serine protease [Gammaproteobacteria bacterium]NNK02937.1 rhomboid family intramembrane serine protease [Xanthomonadales bacterium]NNL00073.1 rhomboid family intramembrane serine protease [Xanthomonadales bacterium]